VDQAHFAAGEAAYEAGDFDAAAREYLAAVFGTPATGSGRAYHQAGNALVKLKRYDDAATVYAKALDDSSYDLYAVVAGNLGAALSAAGRHAEALTSFDTALADPAYPTAYKALQGRAGALYELERYSDAATAYREAAWADGNPDPGRALNNLGLTFMALGKPQDAVEAFKAAIGVDGYSSKGRASSNLAQAYVEMGFFEEAVREFENARDRHGYVLAGDALAVYEKACVAARGDATAEIAPPIEPPEVETIEGWATGELSSLTSLPDEEGAAPDEEKPGPDAGDEDVALFFSKSEAQMRVEDRDAKKSERRAARTPARIAVRVLIVLAIVVVVVGGSGGLIYLGYGYPTQEQTVTSLMNAYRSGTPYSDFWVAVPQTDVKQEMRQLPARFSSFSIQGVDRSALKSTARVVVKLDTGSPLVYDIQLVREGVGWKVDGISNAWSSTGG
jgi:tetratricopeptide (TPR) repeat protein